jgi:hypothetical protein
MSSSSSSNWQRSRGAAASTTTTTNDTSNNNTYGGGWHGARLRWERQGQLTPLEKVGAVLSAGQLLRISTVSLMAFFRTSAAVVHPSYDETTDATGGARAALPELLTRVDAPPMAFFHIMERQSDGAAALQPTSETSSIYAHYASVPAAHR